jgi:hypothetical protein
MPLGYENAAVFKRFHRPQKRYPGEMAGVLSWDSVGCRGSGAVREKQVETGAGSLWRGGGLNRGPGPGF